MIKNKKKILFPLLLLALTTGLISCNQSTSIDNNNSSQVNTNDSTSIDNSTSLDDTSSPWDDLGGESEGSTQPPADINDIYGLSEEGQDILDLISDNQKEVDTTETKTELNEVTKISTAGHYLITGNIVGKINVKVEGVTLYLGGCNISNLGEKVISSDYGLKIVLVEGTDNTVTNRGEDAASSNAISVSGDLTIIGNGTLNILSTKSGIKADGKYFGLGGNINISAGTNHGVAADSLIIIDGIYNIVDAGKDGLHAETEDDILLADPTFKDNRGYVYINGNANITINDIYGDGIQADTFVLIEGGNITISNLPTWIAATTTDGCYKLSNGVYSRVSADDIRTLTGYYQLSQSVKGIKVGEIDYEDAEGVEYVIYDNTNYSLIINGGALTVDVTDDALHVNSGNLLINDGQITLSTLDDGIAADQNLTITNGSINILTSYEGIEGETINIKGGTIKVKATDDGINASSDATEAIQKTTCYISISGGRTYVDASGDGIDSNGGAQISGGELYVSGPTSNGDASLDTETGLIVTGGTLIAVGSSGMVETPATNSTQYCVSVNLSSSVNGDVVLKQGDDIISKFAPNTVFGTTKSYQSIVLSSSSLVYGQTYNLYCGSKITTFTVNGIITKVGTSSGGPGGRP